MYGSLTLLCAAHKLLMVGNKESSFFKAIHKVRPHTNLVKVDGYRVKAKAQSC